MEYPPGPPNAKAPARKRPSKERPSDIIDFTSALYLGFLHSRADLPHWDRFGSGVPAALREDARTARLAHQLARSAGCQRGLAFASTLHLFRDVLDHLSQQRIGILVDAAAYPISQWGLALVAARGHPVQRFPHARTAGLQRILDQWKQEKRRPLILSDGWCSTCGQPMPLVDYLELLRPYQGYLLLDDTQALGVLGAEPDRHLPYGYGGGGIAAWLGIESSRLIVGSSLAKAFGVPMAFLGGPSGLVRQLSADAASRLHSSPPSVPDTLAASRARWLNQEQGDELRLQLWRRVQQLQNGLWEQGIDTRGGIFPIQRISGLSRKICRRAHQDLQRQGIRMLLTANHGNQTELSLVIRADQTFAEIDFAMNRISKTIRKYA